MNVGTLLFYGNEFRPQKRLGIIFHNQKKNRDLTTCSLKKHQYILKLRQFADKNRSTIKGVAILCFYLMCNKKNSLKNGRKYAKATIFLWQSIQLYFSQKQCLLYKRLILKNEKENIFEEYQFFVRKWIKVHIF